MEMQRAMLQQILFPSPPPIPEKKGSHVFPPLSRVPIFTFSRRFYLFPPLSAHAGCVRGVAVDALNQLTLTGGADARVRVWKFKSKQLLETVVMDAQVAFLRLHRDKYVTEGWTERPTWKEFHAQKYSDFTWSVLDLRATCVALCAFVVFKC